MARQEKAEKAIRATLDDIAWELEIDDDPRVQEELLEEQHDLERDLLEVMGVV